MSVRRSERDSKQSASFNPSHAEHFDLTPLSLQRSQTFDGRGVVAIGSFPDGKSRTVERRSFEFKSIVIENENNFAHALSSPKLSLRKLATTGDIQYICSGPGAERFRPHSPSDHMNETPSSLLRRKSSEVAMRKKSQGSGGNNMMKLISQGIAIAEEICETEESRNRKALLSKYRVPIVPNPSPGELICCQWTWSARQDVLKYLKWDVAEYINDRSDGDAMFQEADASTRPLLVAKAKAHALCDHLDALGRPDSNRYKGCILLTADQCVIHRGRNLGKPSNKQQAEEFLTLFSNDTISTISAVVVTHYPSLTQFSAVDTTDIHWKHCPYPIIQQIVENSSSICKTAGGLALEDPLLSRLVDKIEGTIDSVFGLPVSALTGLLNEMALELKQEKGIEISMKAESKNDFDTFTTSESCSKSPPDDTWKAVPDAKNSIGN